MLQSIEFTVYLTNWLNINPKKHYRQVVFENYNVSINSDRLSSKPVQPS